MPTGFRKSTSFHHALLATRITFALGVLCCHILCRRENSSTSTCNFLFLLCLLLLLHPPLPWVREPRADYIYQETEVTSSFYLCEAAKDIQQCAKESSLMKQGHKTLQLEVSIIHSEMILSNLFPKNHPFLEALDSLESQEVRHQVAW